MTAVAGPVPMKQPGVRPQPGEQEVRRLLRGRGVAGLLKDAALEGMAGNLLSCLVMPGGREWWEETKRGIYPEVVELIEAALARPETLPPSWEEFFPYWMRLAD